MINIENLNILNLIVIFCIPFVSFNICLIKKNNDLINLFFSSIVEIIVFLTLIKSEKFYYAVIVMYTLKSMIFLPQYINILSVLTVFVFSFKHLQMVYVFNFFINLYINKINIVNNIKNINEEYKQNKKRLKENINHKETLKQLSNKQLEKQIEYNDYIKSLNQKIQKTISESEVPIFILNLDKTLVSYNVAFENLMKNDYINIKKFNIKEYFEFKFKNYEDVFEKFDNKISSENIILETKFQKTYKFTFVLDKIDEKNVFICTLKDITQTTLIQNRLKESEEKYKKLMDVLDEGVFIICDENLDYINEKGAEIFSLEQNETCFKNLVSSLKGKFVSEFKNLLHKIQNEIDSKTSIQVETKNNKFLDFILVNMKISNKKCVLAIAIDVTNIHNTLIKIKESEKTYKLLLQTLPEGIIILDKTYQKELYKNESSINFLKVIGSENLNFQIKKYIKEQEFGVFKKFTIDKDKNLDINLAIIDRKDENKYIVVFRTLDYEYKIQNIKKELKKVEKDNKFKTDLMIEIANDIKKPLEIISDSNKQIEDLNEKSEHIKNYTKLVKQNTNRLTRLLNNINEISVDDKQITVKKQKCNVVDLVENIILKSKYYIEKNNLSYKFVKNISNETVDIDVEKVEKIILNLLSNAIKYTKKGEITILINEYEEKIGVSIKDTGIGIPNDKLDMIFMNFEQVDTTLSRGCEGTGIGLAVVKKLCDILDIKISIKSEQNKGSEFEILLEKSNVQNIYDGENIFIDSEKVDIEYSDIYLNF